MMKASSPNNENFIEIKNGNTLVFHFPNVHDNAILNINFIRTLRVPDDGRLNFLPPGLDEFQLRHVKDYQGKVPESWIKHGGVVLPMYQAEAMWINFDSPFEYPFAVKIATGKICAVTGKTWESGLLSGKKLTEDGEENLQNYVAVPEQPWIDGFCVKKGEVRQFVAMPLGQGITVEEQVAVSSDIGGIQIQVYPLKKAYYQEPDHVLYKSYECDYCSSSEMGLAEGGKISQSIYEDKHDVSEYEINEFLRVFTHILNSQMWTYVTGEKMPQKPVIAEDYNHYHLPWFDYYDEDCKSVHGSRILDSVKSINEATHDFEDDVNVKDPEIIISPHQKSVRIQNSDF